MTQPKFDSADEAYKPMETTSAMSEPATSDLQDNCSPEVLRRLEELGYIDAGLDI